MGSQKKTATEKDVRYALEYGNERLIRTYDMVSHKTLYTLSPSNLKVPEHIFRGVEEYLEVDSHGLLEGHAQSYKARSATRAQHG